MAFNKKGFMKAKFQSRTEDIDVPEMKMFFEDGDNPVWKVRGLTGVEIGQSNEASEKNKNMAAIIDGLVSDKSEDKSNSIKKLVGINQTPDDIAKRIEMLIMGSIDPVVDLEFALRVCENYPIEFFQITNAITRLTGKGRIVGKLKSSGVTPTSEQN